MLENIHTPPTEGIGISWGVGGSIRPKNLKKCMKLNWNFQRGGGVLEKNPFHGGGMDIFWNYTFCGFVIIMDSCIHPTGARSCIDCPTRNLPKGEKII